MAATIPPLMSADPLALLWGLAVVTGLLLLIGVPVLLLSLLLRKVWHLTWHPDQRRL